MEARLALALTWLSGLIPCLAAPSPAIVQGPGLWTLDVSCDGPWDIELGRGPAGEVRFWYAIITIVNNTGRDAQVIPQAELVTDTFQVLAAGRGVPPAVYEMIKSRHGRVYPFLEPWPAVPVRVLPGPDQARDYALVWRDLDAAASSVQVFVGGLSNELAAIAHPTAYDQAGRAWQVYLRKTLRLEFALSPGWLGQAAEAGRLVARDWVMR